MKSDKYVRHLHRQHTFLELLHMDYIFVPRETFQLLNEADFVSEDTVCYIDHNETSVTVQYLTGYLKGKEIQLYDKSLLKKVIHYSITFSLDLTGV